MMRVFRDEIARHLIDEAERKFPDQVKFHFEEGVSSVNLAQQTVVVSGRSGDHEASTEYKLSPFPTTMTSYIST